MSGSESEDKQTSSEASVSEDTTSESEEEIKGSLPKKRLYRKYTVTDSEGRFYCNHCNEGFVTKNQAYKHTSACGKSTKTSNSVKCSWCNLEFKNRGNLATHAFFMHGDSSYKAIMPTTSQPEKIVNTLKCDVCQQTFSQRWKLKYHIRKMHFNLKAKQPYAELKKVNQVWFEKVLNSNNVIEIKKTGLNTLVMRKLDENTAIKVRDIETETIDLSHLYPCDQRPGRAICEFCKGAYNKRDLKKHMEEVHMKIAKHHCNNCNRSFKRSYQFLQHICNKQRKLRGVRQSRRPTLANTESSSADIRITSVESLSMPWA